jgi:hypothetical protein
MFGKHKPKIETVQWSWAKTVQSPGVYRDDEFTRAKTKEEALQDIDFLMTQPKGLTYTITVLRDGEYLTYWRHSMPCLGGLVKYRDSHGDRHFMNPYFPRDIRVAFPEGDIIYIACAGVPKAKLNSAFWEFMYSAESPWVTAFGSKDTVIFKDSYFVLTNMNTDPTVFYSLMRLGGMVGWYPSPYKNWNPKAEILALRTGQADPRRLAGQKPLRISGGTWADGYGYTRPYNESIFKTLVPTAFPDFSKLAGYPQADYKNTHFVKEMKSVFGVDVSGGVPAEEKYNKALTEAWDYFKLQAQTMSDEPGDQQSILRAKFLRDTVKKDVQGFASLLMQGEHQSQAQAEY